MSYLLELLGKGLDSEIGDLLDRYFWSPQSQTVGQLAMRSKEHPDWPDLHFQLGLAYLRGSDLEAAVDHLGQACRRKPDYAAARLALAAAYVEQGRTQQALGQLVLANQTKPGEPPILFAIGFCHEKLRQGDKAAEYYRDTLTRDPSCTVARERLAALAVFNDDVPEAIAQYEALQQENPGDPWVHGALAQLHYRAGQYQEAVTHFENAIALEPENWSLLDDEVEALVAEGSIREAIERLHELIERQGPFADLHVRLADLYSQVGDDEAAMTHYREALEIQPTYLEANVKLGTHNLINGRWEEAAEAFHRSTEISDRLLANYIGMGVAHSACGRRQDAVNSFELAAAVEPNSTLLLSEMARLQLKAAVAQEFDKTFKPDTDVPVADVDFDNDDLIHKQIERHAQQVEIQGGHADLRYRYGVLLRSQGRLGEAMEQFAKAVEINPAYTQAIIKLGVTQQDLGLADQAIETFKRALEIKPQFVDLHYRLGLLYTDRRQFDQAVAEMEIAADGKQDNEQIRAGLALSLQNMGLMDRAAATWRSLWKIHAPQR
jgi:tetratricopeptide (TPR) repeat protein